MTLTSARTISESDRYVVGQQAIGPVSPPKESSVDVTGPSSSPARSAPWLTEVKARLRSLTELSPDWDGYGSSPATVEAAHSIEQLLAHFIWTRTERPHTQATAEGGLSFEWRRSGIVLELEVESDGAIQVYVRDASRSFEWEGPLGQEPDGIEKWAWRLSEL